MDFDFNIPEHPDISMLNGEDRRFFDLDIRECHLRGFPKEFWDKALNEFKNRIHISICDRKDIPQEVGNNVIVFSTMDRESEINAFFRHLRNAYSHFHVHRVGNNFYIIVRNDKEKESDKRISMRGKVKASDLKDFCFRIIDLYNEKWDEYYDSVNKNYE